MSDFWAQEVTIGTLARNPNEQLVVRRCTNQNGAVFVDLRVFYLAGETWLPSRKGLLVPDTQTGELMDLIDTAVEGDASEDVVVIPSESASVPYGTLRHLRVVDAASD